MKPTEEWLQEQLAGYGTYQITTKVLPGKELNYLLLFRRADFFSAERYGKALPGKDVYMSPVIMSRKKQLLFFADREIKLDLTVFVLLSISTRYDYARCLNASVEHGVFS